MLTINHVTKKYGNQMVLDDISLELKDGLYGLLAPNGAGKTTLIKMITTLLYPSKGEILYDGKEILTLGDQYRDKIGYLPQTFGYYKNKTPYQLLMYLAALKGIDNQTARMRIDALLNQVSLMAVKHKKMKTFSGGMIQRVGIAQAMLNDPQILILDEPTAGLDPKERVRFRNIITNLSKDRIVILSTHIVSDIETIANQVIMIKDHEMMCQASPQAICESLKGRVFETGISHIQNQSVFLLTQWQEAGETKVRFIGEDTYKDNPNMIARHPHLEDVFLYSYRDENETPIS